MAVKLGDAFVALGVDERSLDRGLNRARSSVNGFLRNLTTGIGQGVGQAVAAGIGNLIRNSMTEVSKAINLASDLNESLNKTSVAFGDSAQEILDWSRTSATAFGQSRGQALEAAASFGLLFRTMGLGSEESAAMSRQLVELASDMASINNISPEEALTKLRAGLVGEIEPLRTVGVLLNATAVEAKAMELGLASSTKAITEQDKVMARYQLILDQTALTQGDFARTADDLANAQRILTAQITDAGAEMGQALLPIRLAFVRGLSDLIEVVKPYGENIIRSFVSGMADAIIFVLPVLAELRQVFVQLLRPGSPPRLLPELTRWGAGAMQAYLEGWTTADFDALKSVGGMIENVVRSFAGSGDIKETDLVSTVFGTQRTITQAIRDFRNLGRVTEATLGSIADAAGPAGAEIAGLVREYFELQSATRKVSDAQSELNEITDRYAQALNPLQGQLDDVRAKQQEIRENQRLEELGEILRDPNAETEEKQLARLEAQEIQLERQARAIEDERDTAVDAAQAKIDAAKAEEAAQQSKYDAAASALDQQARTNALIEEETSLRLRLANEALAEQERALREIEAAQRELEAAEHKRLGELERIADAQFRMKIATSDTAGQLALWQAELDKATKGSVEYFDALTQVFLLTKRLRDEQEAGGPSDDGTADTIDDIAEASEKWPEVVKMEEALSEFFATIAGQDNVVTDLTWGQGIVDAFTNISRAAEEAAPFVQNIFDIIMGKEVEGAANGGDPFAGNFWLEGFIPFLRNLQTTLEQYRDGDWASMWQRFKDYVDSVIEKDDGTDKTTFGLYTWLRDTAIPLLETLATTEWAEMWTEFEDAVQGAWQGIIDFIDACIAEITTAIEEFRSLFGFTPDVFGDNPRINPNKVPQPSIPGEDVLPGSPFASFNGISPGVPPFAGAGGGNVTGDTIVFQIEQNIATNGDFGGARQGALEGIRQALINRTVQGTT